MDDDYKVGAIKYKDCRLMKVRINNCEEWRLDITCRKTKGNGPQITFSLSERTPRIYCPVVLFLALAFLDEALIAPENPSKLAQIQIPSYLQSLEFVFKDTVQEVNNSKIRYMVMTDVLQDPIFKKVWRGSKVTNDCLCARAFRAKLHALSVAAGFPIPVLPYAIRRGAANSFDSNCPYLYGGKNSADHLLTVLRNNN